MTESYSPFKGGERLDVFLAEESGKTRSQIKKLIDEGNVTVNNKKEKSSYVVRENDKIDVVFKEENQPFIGPVNIPLDIVYEDDDVIVVNKQQGLTVHAGTGTDENTLVNALLYHTKNLSHVNGDIRPGIVHRIDKDTSGLLVVAKNDEAHKNLERQIANKTCKRIYVALLNGNLKKDEGTIDTFLDRSKKDRTAFAVSESGRRAITHFKVLKRYGGYTLCQFSLETGRTHQIRVHCKYLGNPVVGDKVYGPDKCRFNLKGQLLHACKLGFVHPVTNEEMVFQCEMPKYFKDVLSELKEI